jgi:uncharacterized protein DUF6602
MLAYYRAVRRQHRGLSGMRREDLLRDTLRDFLPARIAVERGEIISTDGSCSDAVDLIVYDGLETPVLDRSQGGGVVVPIEGVFAVIEVSSKLTGSKLKDDLENIRSVKRMTRRAWFTSGAERPGELPPHWPVLGFCFAYDSIRLHTLLQRLRDLDNPEDLDSNVDMICSLSKGCILNGIPLFDAEGNQVQHPRGGGAWEDLGPTPAPGSVRFAQRVPKNDEGDDALRAFYTVGFGAIVRRPIEPINMFAYWQFDYKSAQ